MLKERKNFYYRMVEVHQVVAINTFEFKDSVEFREFENEVKKDGYELIFFPSLEGIYNKVVLICKKGFKL